MKNFTFIKEFALVFGLLVFSVSLWGQIGAWDFTGVGGTSLPTYAATTFDANLISASGASNITRGPGAPWSTGTNSFRTTGFQNNGISVSNTDYFQVTLAAASGYKISLSTIDARFAGTSTFAASPGVSSQFAYSLDGINFTLIGSPSITIGTPATLPQINLSGISALQNVESGNIITIRYYASGQTATGGWGFNSPSSGINGLAFGGEVSLSGGNPIVATPTFNPPGGNYYTTQNVSIATETPGATIYYTTDGSDPDEFSNEYVNPVPVSVTTTLKARAYATGYDPSAVATALYKFPVEVANIATLRAGATDGTVYRLTGEAILTAKDAFNNRKFIEDATAAIMIFDNAGIITTEYNIGDGIEDITGTLNLTSNMLRFIPTVDPGAASSTANPVLPAIFTIDQLVSGDQAKLVKIQNVSFTAPGTFANGQNYTITDGINDLVFRTDFWNVDYIGTSIPELPQNIAGVIIQFNDVLQIVARNLADFELPAIPWPVTFYLDMTNETGTFTTVDVAGSFNSWGSPGDMLTLVQDNIYEFTTSSMFYKDDIIEFKFRKDGNWGTSEPNPNRSYTVAAGTNVYHAVYGVMVPAKIGYANLQWPATGSIDLGWNYDVYAQVWANGLTGGQLAGATPNLNAWIGFNTTDTDPSTWTNWVPASFNVDAGNNDEFVANIGAAITQSGTYYYASRFKLGFADYVYGGYSSGGGGFWDGVNYVSGVLTVNINEPANHVTGFSANADSYSAITLSWTDSDAAGYLIKGSAVSYAAIDDPVDGTPEADGGLVKNITSGIELHQFTGLMAETDYFFKIFPYNGTAGAINYKTDGTVPEATATTAELPGYLVGDFGFTATSGTWGTIGNWRLWDGTGWNTTTGSEPTVNDNVYILGGKTAILNASNKNAKNLIVEPGAKLYANNATMVTPRYVNVTGNIVCDGMIGNGSGVDDVISFNINGVAQSISGSGSFTANRIRKNTTGNSSLSLEMDIELRYNGLAFLNQATLENAFHVTVQPGVHINCAGNVAPPTGGYQLKSNDNLTIYGQVTLTGNLDNQAGAAAVAVKSSGTGNGSLIQPNEAPATVEAYITPTRWHYVSSPIDNANTSIFTGLYMQWWNELTGKWRWVQSADSTLATDMQGYSIWAVSPKTLSFAGTLNAGARSYNLTYSDVNPEQDPGFNFIGNPYPSAIDWDGAGWTKTNVDNALYVWTGSQYASYINGFGVNGQTSVIPPHQGFFVYTSNLAGGLLGVDNAARVHSNQPNLKSGENTGTKLRLDVTGNSQRDEMIVYADPMATPAFDGQLDAFKLKGVANAPQMYSIAADGRELSINSLPAMEGNVTVPVGFETGVSGIFELKISELNGLEDIPVFLQDHKENKIVNLKTFGTYKFAAATEDLAHRFTLHFTNNNLPSDDASLEGIFMYPKDKSIVFVSEEPITGLVKVFDLTGREVTAKRLVETSYATIEVLGNRGYYIVSVVTGQGVYNQKVFLK